MMMVINQTEKNKSKRISLTPRPPLPHLSSISNNQIKSTGATRWGKVRIQRAGGQTRGRVPRPLSTGGGPRNHRRGNWIRCRAPVSPGC